MKKILLLLLFIPFLVFAEDCDVSKITITSMEQTSIEGDTEIIEDPTFQDRSINLNFKMYEVGDSITYNLTIKNDSDEDYMIDENSFTSDSDYIEYTLTAEDNSNVVRAKSNKNMTLIVTYKNEIDDILLTNNNYNASNTLKLSMNTQEKAKELEELSTNPIAPKPIIKEVKNPITSSIGFKILIVVLFTTISIVLLTIINKKQYNKYIILIGIISLLPTIYAVCKCDIEVETTIEIEKVPKLFNKIISLSKEENACITKYEGEVTDSVGQTVQASNVYFDNCKEKRNVIFNNMCWQIIRTTENSGIKMVYNGDVVDGKCKSSRGNHKGIVQSSYGSQNIASSYLYGSSFTYDTSTNEFTLTDTTTATWSDSTYENLIGKFTCKSSSDTCTRIYQLNDYYSFTSAYLSYYKIDNTNIFEIGTSSFNAEDDSPSKVGYMFNKTYNYKYKELGTSEFKFGSTFTYANGTYTLAGTTQNISDWSTGYNQINNTHYTCWNITGECDTISYVYHAFFSPSYSSRAHYINLTNGKNVKDALIEMLSSDDVNKYNSSIKGIIDAWYAKELSSKTNMLEDTVYCNARDVIDYGGWNPDGGNINGIESYLLFKNNVSTTNLACPNKTDQFAVGNNSAKLTYPVALISKEEMNNIEDNSLITEESSMYWLLSPSCFGEKSTQQGAIYGDGRIHANDGNNMDGVRPAITLKNDILISSGTGSETDPWVIE